jgi:protein-tyrosine phosphatase
VRRPSGPQFPERNARAIAAVAQAEPGGVLIHCVGGKDRAGEIAIHDNGHFVTEWLPGAD